MADDTEFNSALHVRFLAQASRTLPAAYQAQEANRLTLLYFAVSALDLLGALDKLERDAIVEWVYANQVVPDPTADPDCSAGLYGFRGSGFLGLPYDPECTPHAPVCNDRGHIAMTYTALLVLTILGDDLSRVNKRAVIRSLSALQHVDGSFSPDSGGSENDIRFVYCAAAISFILDDFSGFDTDRAAQFILKCQSYDGGFAQNPWQESHGGSTYCGLAALHLMGKRHLLTRTDDLIHWCIERQVSGFQGRINKDPDTCYSFWIGGTLKLLDCFDYVNPRLCRGFMLSCQHKIGGFSKWPNTLPDILHTYYGLCGLSLIGKDGLASLEPGLAVTVRTADYIKSLHAKWRQNAPSQ